MSVRIISVLAAIVLAVGCSVFEPRSPEYPDPPPFDWYQPNQYQTVLVNLENTMENLSSSYYVLCFDSTFTFVADNQDTAQYNWGWSDWDYYTEQTAIILIFEEALSDTTVSSDTAVSVIFSTLEEQPDPEDYFDSITIYREYEFSFASSEYPPAEGIAKIYMARPYESGLWSIYRWEDNRGPDHQPEDNTWGVFKGFYLFN